MGKIKAEHIIRALDNGEIKLTEYNGCLAFELYGVWHYMGDEESETMSLDEYKRTHTKEEIAEDILHEFEYIRSEQYREWYGDEYDFYADYLCC